MSYFPIETVRSEHNIRTQQSILIDLENDVLPIDSLKSITGPINNLELKSFLNFPIYFVNNDEGSSWLFNAVSEELLSPIKEDLVIELAKADFSGVANDPKAEFISQTNNEYRGTIPIWKVTMGDKEDTRLYISPNSGEVVARRNNIWRVYDFFWMLHIMDYENRSNFNNPLVIIASIIALIASISGLWLLIYRFSKRDFRWLGLKDL
jgi:hypothetical protein